MQGSQTTKPADPSYVTKPSPEAASGAAAGSGLKHQLGGMDFAEQEKALAPKPDPKAGPPPKRVGGGE